MGKTHRRNDRGDRGNVGIIRSPIRASILPDLSGHERAYFAVMHNAARTPFQCAGLTRYDGSSRALGRSNETAHQSRRLPN